MKRVYVSMALAAAILSTSCLGSFSAFNGLKDWNQQATNNKYVNNVIFWGLNIIPVYGLFFLGDAIIFNVIEFWSGSNPIAMKPGEMESQIITHEGVTYELIATTNTMKVNVLDGKDEGRSATFFYSPEEQSWNLKQENKDAIKLAAIEEGSYVVYLPEGEIVKMNAATTTENGLAILNSKLVNYNEALVSNQ